MTKKKRSKKHDNEQDGDEEARRLAMMGRAYQNREGPAHDSGRSSTVKNSLKDRTSKMDKYGDGLDESMFASREDFLIAKNEKFMKEMEIELFKEKYINDLKALKKRGGKKYKLIE